MRKVLVSISLLLFITTSGYTAGKHTGSHESRPKGHHWQAPASEKSKKNPIAATQISINRGKKIYLENCAECHGNNGEGDGPLAKELKVVPTNLKDMASHHSDGDFAWKIRVGKGEMPSWGEVLSADEIWDTVNFIKSFTSSAKGHHSSKNKNNSH